MLTEGIIKIEAEINEIGNKKPIEKIIKPSTDSLESSIKLKSHLASLMKKKTEKKTNYQYQEWKLGQHHRSYRYADKCGQLDKTHKLFIPQKTGNKITSMIE